MTNSPAIALGLERASSRVVIAPGEVDLRMRAIADGWTVEFLRRVNLDTAFLSGAGPRSRARPDDLAPPDRGRAQRRARVRGEDRRARRRDEVRPRLARPHRRRSELRRRRHRFGNRSGGCGGLPACRREARDRAGAARERRLAASGGFASPPPVDAHRSHGRQQHNPSREAAPRGRSDSIRLRSPI